MKSVSEILQAKKLKPDKRNTKEYQAFGNMLAEELGDTAHRALYIKLAKNEDRNLMELAREFCKKAETAHTKGRLFMWKLTQLKQSKK